MNSSRVRFCQVTFGKAPRVILIQGLRSGVLSLYSTYSHATNILATQDVIGYFSLDSPNRCATLRYLTIQHLPCRDISRTFTIQFTCLLNRRETMESCSTCATILSQTPAYTKEELSLPQDRRVACCSRIICGKCIHVRHLSLLVSCVTTDQVETNTLLR